MALLDVSQNPARGAVGPMQVSHGSPVELYARRSRIQSQGRRIELVRLGKVVIIGQALEIVIL